MISLMTTVVTEEERDTVTGSEEPLFSFMDSLILTPVGTNSRNVLFNAGKGQADRLVNLFHGLGGGFAGLTGPVQQHIFHHIRFFIHLFPPLADFTSENFL